MWRKRIISLGLLCAMLLSAASCGSDAAEDGTKTSADDSSSAETESKYSDYDFPELDCGGETFTILNLESEFWGMYTYLDFEQQTGEQLDDAVYNRDRQIEELFNIKLETVEAGIDDLSANVRQSVQSNDSLYDAAYVKGEKIAPLITDSLLVDLSTVSGLQLDKEWWNQNVINAARIGDKDSVFFAVSDLSLTAFDLTWCIMFNENMTEELGLDKPYDLVRNGKWTLDELKKYAAAGANLNGDESFKDNVNGNSVYGFASYYNVIGEMLIGAGCWLTDEVDGVPSFALGSERFYSFCEKMASITATPGEYIDANGGDNKLHYERIFKSRRSLFVGAEIKATSSYRDFDDTFGILPAPKLDETQSEYYSWINYLIPLLTIPKDCKNIERTGVILDALSYLSMKDVLPKYYDIRVSQKGLRNEESIEMLGIIRDARYFDASLAYGWTLDFYTALRDQLSKKGDPNTASLVAKNKDKINAKIQATLDLVNAE